MAADTPPLSTVRTTVPGPPAPSAPAEQAVLGWCLESVEKQLNLDPSPGQLGGSGPTFLHLPAPILLLLSVSPVTPSPALKAVPASVWPPVSAQGLAFNTVNDGGGRRFLKGSRVGLSPQTVDEAGAVPPSAEWTVQPHRAVWTEQGRRVSAGGKLCTLHGLLGNLP